MNHATWVLLFLVFVPGLIGYLIGRIQANNKKKLVKKNWVVFEVGNEAHTIPVNDKHAHITDDSCGCSPKNIPVQRSDGSIGWSVVHNAADGRS